MKVRERDEANGHSKRTAGCDRDFSSAQMFHCEYSASEGDFLGVDSIGWG